jgi:hypothetical protein
VWDQWNAKSPTEQAADAIRADAAFLARLDALTGAERDQWRLNLFGAEQGLADLLRFRLGEHALHTWDVAVALDPRATVAPDATALLVDVLDQFTGRLGKPTGDSLRVDVRTDAPQRRFLLEVGPDSVQLAPTGDDSADGTARLHLPAEALLRLVYGRLDAEHTPALEAEQVDLDVLRRVFPGA